VCDEEAKFNNIGSQARGVGGGRGSKTFRSPGFDVNIFSPGGGARTKGAHSIRDGSGEETGRKWGVGSTCPGGRAGKPFHQGGNQRRRSET